MKKFFRFFSAVTLLSLLGAFLTAKFLFKLSAVVLLLLAGVYYAWLSFQGGAQPWVLAPGYQMEEHATGFSGPVSIAFLHRPAPGPEAPLYLVSELRGAIKVVLRNREVRPFADMPDAYQATLHVPKAEGTYGLHGLCFSPDDRFLFSTSVYEHEGILKNKITRWESAGGGDWLTGRIAGQLAEPFQNGRVGSGHSAGNCFVDGDGKLWVGMGDGGRVEQAHDPNFAVGKLFRINQDFTAPPDNPFFDPAAPLATRSFVYTMGLRNPWAIAQTRLGDVFAADNGPQIDRLVQARPGFDFPWNGSNTSMTYNALLVWPKAIAPVALFFVPPGAGFMGLENHFVVSAAKGQEVISIPYTENGGIGGDPVSILRRPRANYRAESLTGIARGADGIYVAHMKYGGEGFFQPSAIFRITRTPGAATFRPAALADGPYLFEEKGCRSCHKISGKGGETGPALDNLSDRLAKRLQNEQYVQRLGERLNFSSSSPQARSAAPGLLGGPLKERVAGWVKLKMAVPDFENPRAQMPQLPFSAGQIEALAHFLLENR